MSTTVDSRVVEMRFDNKNFESNVATSMSTLDKLKQKLHLSGASKGLDELGRSAKNVDMSGLGRGIETVQAKFSAMQVIGVTALANIANSAVNTGKRMVAALTIDPIRTGFQEYETKMNSVQTIMSNTASKGTTMSDVTKTLDDLNLYADKTIYNFQEMTRNIGTFTAAGVGLKESASAIKGIANLAAASGSSSQQASTAMYQLSQALATGTVKLMDWNSVVNAGMGGEKFQLALKATAREHGVAVDAIIEKNGSFRDSLQAGWLSADILNETLNKFTVDGAKNYSQAMMEAGKWTQEQADALVKEAQAMEDAATKVKTFTQLWDTMKEAAQSGWGQTWELVIGDFEKAKERMTELSDMFGKALGDSANSRNDFLGGALSSSWDVLTRKLTEAGVETDKFQEKVTELAKSSGVDLAAMTEDCGSFEKALIQAFATKKLDKSILKEAIKSFTGDIGKATATTGEMSDKMAKYGDIVNKVINGDFGYGAERIDALTKAGYDYATIQDLVNEKMGSSVRHLSSLSDEQIKNADSLSKMSEEQLKSEGYTDDQIKALQELKKAAEDSGSSISELIDNFEKPSGASLIWRSVIDILKSVGKAIGAVKQAWTDIFPPMTSNQLYSMIESFAQFIARMRLTDEGAQNITRTFKGLFAILDIISTIVGGGLKFAFSAVSKVLGAFDMDVLEFTGNIGDALVNFRDWVFENNAVATSINNLIDKIPGAIELVKNWVDSFTALPEVKAAIDGISNAFDKMVEIGKSIIDGLTNGLQGGLTSIPDILTEIGLRILNAIKTVLGIHSPSTEMFDVGVNFMIGLWNGIKSFVGTIIEYIKKFCLKLKEIFSDMDWSKLFAVGVSVGVMLLVKKISDIIAVIASPLTGLGHMFDSVGDFIGSSTRRIKKVLKQFGRVLNAFAFSIAAGAMKNIAISLGILVVALVALTYVDTTKLWNAVAVVTVMAGVLVAMMVAVEKISKMSTVFESFNIAGLAIMLVGLGTSLLLIGTVVKKLGELDPDAARDGFIRLGGLVVVIAGVVAAYGLLVQGDSGKYIAKLGSMLIKMSIAMGLMVGVVKLASMLTDSELIRAAKCMAGFALFVAALTLASRIAGAGMSSISKLGSMLIKISIAMGLMVGIVKLASMLTEEELKKGESFMVAFAIFTTAMMAITRIGGTAKIGGTLLAMSSSMLILAGVVKVLSGIAWPDLIKAGVGIAALTGVMFALSMMVKSVGPEAAKIGLTLLTMSVSIGILAGITVMMSLMSVTGLAKGLTVVGILSLFMTRMIKATRKTHDVHENLIVMAVAIGVMAASVAALSGIDGTKLFGATVALSILMGMFALIEKASGSITKSIGPLIVMTAVVGVLAGIVYLLSKVDAESSLVTVASLSTLLLALSASMVIISKAGTISPMALAATGIMTLVVGGLALILGLLAKCEVGSTIEIAASLSLLLLSLTASVTVLSLVGPLAGGALAAIGVMAALIVAIGGLLAGLGALVTYFPQMETFLDKGIPILEKIGYGLGSFFGNIIGGFSAGITSGLPEIGLNLSMFMVSLQPFILGARTIDETALAGVTALAKMFAMLAGANILEKVSQWVTGSSSMATFATGLDAFADAIVSFSSKVKGKIDDASVLAAANAGLMFANMQKMISGSGGVVQWFAGKKNLGAFGKQLEDFGTAIVKFSSAVSAEGAINEDAIKAAADAGTIMSELQSKVQPSGGVVQWFLGEKNFKKFGKQLEEFGSSIVKFSQSVSADGAINKTAIQAASNAGTIMATMQQTLVGTGGVVQWFTGEKDMEKFGKQLEDFGTAIVKFSSAVSAEGAINKKAIQAAADAGTIMSELQSNLEASGGVVDFFTGRKGLDKFGQQIVLFGQAIVDFSGKVKDNVDEKAVTAAANAGKVMAELQKAIPEDNWFDGKVSLEEFGRDVKLFGVYLAEYAGKVTGIDIGAILKSITAANRLIALSQNMNNLDSTGVENFKVKEIGKRVKEYASQVGNINAEVVASSITSAKKLIGLINSTATIDNSGVANFKVDSIGKSMKSYSDSVAGINPGLVASSISAIRKLIDLINSMAGMDTSGVSAFKTAINSLSDVSLDGVVKAFSGAASKLSTVGASMVDSLTQGMRSKQASFTLAATSMVANMQTSISNKKASFTTIGVALMTNLITGITNQKAKVSSAFTTSISAAATSIRGKYSSFSSAGQYLAEGFADGIALKAYLSEVKARAMAKAAADAINDELVIRSPSRVTKESGRFFDEGLAEGITESSYAVTDASTELGNASNAALVSSITNGSEDVVAAQNEVGDSLVESIDETNDRVSEAKDRELATENAYWESLLKTRQNGVDAAKYATMDLAAFEEETLSQATEVWSGYLDEIDSKADSIMSQRNLFDAIPEKEGVTKGELTENLASQVREYEKFSEVIASLNERIDNDSLKEFINTLSVDSLSELEAINSMTESELNEYADMYNQKYALAKTSALTQLDSLKTDTETKLSDLFGGVTVSTESFAAIFDGSMDSIKQYVSESLAKSEAAQSIGKNLTEGVAQGMSSATGSLNEAAGGMITSALDAAKQVADIHSPSKLFEKEIGERLTEGVAIGMTKMLSDIAQAINGMVDSTITKFGESYARFVEIGAYVAEGFKEGILSKADEIAEAAAELAREAMEAVEDELDEHSPSKEMFKLGAFAGKGFTNGLTAYSDVSYDAGSEIANSARRGLGKAISKVYDLVNRDMTMQPTIRPVFDLSSVESGVGLINGMFDGGHSVGITGNLNAIRSMSSNERNVGMYDVVSAIDKLRKDLGGMESSSYSVNGITYDDGSNISDAVKSLIRAAKVERRT